MLKILFAHPKFMIPVLILLLLGIICQISMGVLLNRLIWETENMSNARNKSLQQLKLKFSNCCRLHEGMSNVPIFVDKYINRLKVHGLSLSTLKHISGQLVLLSILIAGIGACRGIISGEAVIYIAPYYIVSFLGLYCYFAISSLIDVSAKTKILRTNLIDYLENHLADRRMQSELDLKLITPDEEDRQENPETPQNAQNAQPALSNSEARELETLLKELLT